MILSYNLHSRKRKRNIVIQSLGDLGEEDPLEEGMATHFSILSWRLPWTEDPEGIQCIG